MIKVANLPNIKMLQQNGERIVPPEAARQRLDLYLASSDLKLTRSRIQTLIRSGEIQVNGVIAVKTGVIVLPGDRITIRIPEPSPIKSEPENIPLDVCYEDDWLLVVNKPPGMVVHPACGHWSGTLVNALLHHCGPFSPSGDTIRPGIVHRLDKDTSGLLVVAKQEECLLALSAQLAERTMTRKYIALVWGVPREGTGTINAHIGRDPSNRQRMAVVAPERGRPSVTHYQVVKNYVWCSLLSIKLETGRTHQIRVHLASLGHPVFGDPTYGGRTRGLLRLPPPNRVLAKQALDRFPRQALHAASLSFRHPISGEIIGVQAPLPDDMQETIRLVDTPGTERLPGPRIPTNL